MGIIHQQGNIRLFADFRNSANIRRIAQIVRSRHIDRKGLLCHFRKLLLHLLCRDGTGTERTFLSFFRYQPFHTQVHQGTTIQKCFVGISRRQHHRSSPCSPRPLQSKEQHGADTLGGAFRSINRLSETKKTFRISFAFGNDTLRIIQFIGTADFRDVHFFAAQKGHALVSRHMETGRVLFRIAIHKITDWCSHCNPSSLSATFNAIAHSILFLNRSQPYS